MKGKIGLYGSVAWLSTAAFAKLFTMLMPQICRIAGTASFLAVIVSAALAFAAFFIFYALISRFGGNNLSIILKRTVGTAVGKIASFALGLYFVLYSAYYIYELAVVIKSYALPDTPLPLLLLIFTAVSALLAHKGLNAIVRISSFLFTFFVFSIIFILAFSYLQYTPSHLAPVLGHGLPSVLKAGVRGTGMFFDIFLLTLAAGAVQDKKTFRMAGIISITVSGVTAAAVFICYCMAFNYNMTPTYLSGLFELAETIYLGRAVQRFTSVLSVSATFTSTVLCASSLCASASLISDALSVDKDSKVIIILIAAGTAILSMLNIHSHIIITAGLIILFAIPVILLAASYIRRRGGIRNED